MKQMSITEVKDNFDDVITWIESGKENQIIVTKYEKPIVRMVPYTCNDSSEKKERKINAPCLVEV